MTTQQPVPTIVRSTIVFDRKVRDAVQHGARHAFPNQFCGVLLGRRVGGTTVVVDQLVYAPNVASRGTRRTRYEINPGLLLAWEHQAEKEGLRVVGYVHSSLDRHARPSEEDVARAWPGYVHVVAAVHDGVVTDISAWEFHGQADEFEPVALAE